MLTVTHKISAGIAAIAVLALMGAQADAAMGQEYNQGRDKSTKQTKPAKNPRVPVKKARPQVERVPVKARPVFTPQRQKPVTRWQAPPPKYTPVLKQPQRAGQYPTRITTAVPTTRPIQRIPVPQQAPDVRRIFPTVPPTFNFAGDNSRHFSDEIRRGTPYVHPQSVPSQPRFHDRVTRNTDGFRIGFTQYDSGFHQSSFFFGNYGYWPYSPTVASPWYFYPMLPPYISLTFVYVESQPRWSDSYNRYNWYQPRTGYRYGSLDYAIEDVRTAYIEHDARAISRLIPTFGDIAIYIDGDYRYSLHGSDFSAMLHDSISDVRTTNYRILNVRKYSDGSVLVEAQHSFVDGWNNGDSVYQSIRMVPEGSRYVIREFGTSQRRIYQ